MARQDASLISRSLDMAYGLGQYSNAPEPPDNDHGIPNMTDAEIDTKKVGVQVSGTCYQEGAEPVLHIHYAMPDGTTQTEEYVGKQNIHFVIVKIAQLQSPDAHAQLQGRIQADFLKVDNEWQHLSTHRV